MILLPECFAEQVHSRAGLVFCEVSKEALRHLHSVASIIPLYIRRYMRMWGDRITTCDDRRDDR